MPVFVEKRKKIFKKNCNFYKFQYLKLKLYRVDVRT